MKIVFFGTPEYVVPVLDALHKSFREKSGASPIVAVVTQSPKPTGRKQILSYSPVDTWAHKKEVPIFFDSQKLIKSGIKADVAVLAAFGQIIPKNVLEYFRYGIVNIHPSLLPKYRGASPVQATIAAGDKVTGVTFIKLDELMDHGPILSQFKEDTRDEDSSETLRDRLFVRSAEVIPSLLQAYVGGKVKPKEQDHKKASYTRLLKKEHGFINPKALDAIISGRDFDKDWEVGFIKDFVTHYSPITVHQFLRAMSPWPGVWTEVKLKGQGSRVKIVRLKILKAHIEPTSTIDYQSLIIDTIQLEGKSPVSWKQFKEAYPEAKLA